MFESSSAPLRRLSDNEYRNTVADLFPGIDIPAYVLAPDERLGGFDNLAEGQSASALGVELYAQAAEQIASAAVADLSKWS